jgi:cell division septum initiation protein DivIVA
MGREEMTMNNELNRAAAQFRDLDFAEAAERARTSDVRREIEQLQQIANEAQAAVDAKLGGCIFMKTTNARRNASVAALVSSDAFKKSLLLPMS